MGARLDLPPPPCPLHLAQYIQQVSNVCSTVPKWEQEISDHLWAIRETATPLYLGTLTSGLQVFPATGQLVSLKIL